MSFLGNTGSTSTTQGGGLFGAANATNNASSSTETGTTGGALFGAKPGGNPFGSTNATTGGGSMFGGTSSTTPAGGLFGATSSTATPATGTSGNVYGAGATTNTSSTAGGNLFGTGPVSTGGLFGGAPSTATSNSAATTAAPSLSFSGFGTNKPAESTSTTAPKPASSFFGPPSTPIGTGAIASGIFGAKPADSASGSVPQGFTAPTFGGGLFGAKHTAPASTPTAPPASGFSLGGSNASTAPTFSLGGNKDSSTAPSGGLFGGKLIEKKDGAPAAAPASFVLGGVATTDDKKATASATSLTKENAPSGATASNPVVAVPPPSMLRGKTIEEIVNRWTSELETHVKDFSKFSGEVVVWDRALIENGNNLAALYSHVLAAERQQNEIDQTLDHVEQQQKELMSTLDAYEKVSQEILGGQGGSLRSLDTGPADTERDKNYMLATDLHTNLDDLSASLTQMIDSVNALSTAQKPATEGAEDPMAQISRVLSSHLESLQWIDTSARELDSKVNEVERGVKESGHSFGNGQKGRGFGLTR